MQGLIQLARGTWAFFSKFGWLLPRGIMALYVMFRTLILLSTVGPAEALTYLATQFLAAEYVIHQVVDLAIANTPSYNLFAVLDLFASLIFLFWMISLLKKLIFFMLTESASHLGAYLLALMIVFIMEWSAAWAIHGQWNFIPIYDGIIYLLLNLKPVIFNITILNFELHSFRAVVGDMAKNLTNSNALGPITPSGMLNSTNY